MRYADDNGDESASASDSDDIEATDKNRGVEVERGNEHEGNDGDNEAEELWRALAMSLVAAVGGGRGWKVRESIIMEEMKAALMLFMLKSTKSRPLRKIVTKVHPLYLIF